MNKTLANAKNFVVKNRTKILLTALVVTTTVAVIEQIAIRQHNEFLKEHDLLEKFYYIED